MSSRALKYERQSKCVRRGAIAPPRPRQRSCIWCLPIISDWASSLRMTASENITRVGFHLSRHWTPSLVSKRVGSNIEDLVWKPGRHRAELTYGSRRNEKGEYESWIAKWSNNEELITKSFIAEHGDDPNCLPHPPARTKSETIVWKCRSLEISVPFTIDNRNKIPRPQGRMSIGEIWGRASDGRYPFKTHSTIPEGKCGYGRLIYPVVS